MSKAASTIALMAAQSLPAVPAEGDAPEWVHLLPSREGEVVTGDKRGPYHVTDADEIIRASFAESDRLPIDENHAIDHAAPLGHPSPARGWITEMEARPDGIWGRVEWSQTGRELVSTHAYRGLSPAISHDRGKRVLAILRASLVNRPNLRGLTALNSEEEDTEMTLQQRLAELLGLEAGATDDQIMDALKPKMDGGKDGGDATALQSQLGEIAQAIGLDANAKPETVLNAAKAAKAAATEQSEAFVSLQSRVDELTVGTKRDKAEAFVDQAIRDKRAGVKAERETFIALHMENPEQAAKIVAGLPKLDRTGTTLEPPAPKDGEIALNAEQSQVAALLGQTPKDYAETLRAERGEEAL